MSVGLYRHPTLGETKKYILNNKHVLEIKTDTKQTEDWSRQLTALKDSFLTNTHVKFYLLPEEVYVDREAAYEYEENSRGDSMRVIVYEHFVVTLKEELQMRIKTQEPFAKKELWFLLYALACGAIEMMQIREFTHSVEDIQINPETILLNEYGYVKLMGFYSTPFPLKCRGSYKAPQNNLSSEVLPQKLQICCSATLGRILSSLVLLKQMDEFVDGKLKLFSDAKLLQELKSSEERLGTLYNIIKMMLADNLSDRLMVSELKALLLPYQDQILALSDFTLDREVSRESMISLFVNQ